MIVIGCVYWLICFLPAMLVLCCITYCGFSRLSPNLHWLVILLQLVQLAARCQAEIIRFAADGGGELVCYFVFSRVYIVLPFVAGFAVGDVIATVVACASFGARTLTTVSGSVESCRRHVSCLFRAKGASPQVCHYAVCFVS